MTAMRQGLLWIPPAEDRGAFAMQAPPVPFDGPEPDRVWTLYLHRDPNSPPALPFIPQHHHNAFAEDYVHDWNVFRGKFRYASRAIDGGVWLLLEWKHSAPPPSPSEPLR
jgi:hypothetical protein